MTHNFVRPAFLVAVFTFGSTWFPPLAAQPPRTTAETSDYKETTRHDDVMAFCEKLAKDAPLVRLAEMGKSTEGRKLPLLIIADPPVATPEEAAKSGKLVVFAIANIHAGEVDGKEALMMLARDLALAKERPLLKDLIVIFNPNFNPDGNEKFGNNRPAQAGPPRVGTRGNAQGLDLNRDFIKLETPEVRSLVRFLKKWDAAILIDCHTTNGSYHQYTITYEGNSCPAGDPRLTTYMREKFLPDVGKRLEKATGYKSFFYGFLSADGARWEPVPPTPRYSIHYAGLRNRIGILSESYSYASFKDRVLGTKGFVQAICEYAAANKDQIKKLLSDAREGTVRAGRDPKEKDTVAVDHKQVPLAGRPVNILGYDLKKGEKPGPDSKSKLHEVLYMGGTESTLSVRRPYAYLFPANLTKVTEILQRHGVEVEELREDIELDLEDYLVDKMSRDRPYQKHETVTLKATPRKMTRRVDAGTVLVRTAQPLGSLAVQFLEPQSGDGLVTWNFFDDAIAEGKIFPVSRLVAPMAMTSGRVRPLAEERVMNKPVTFDALFGSDRPPNFAGSPIGGMTWLDDGEHYVQEKEGRLRKVNARTGRSEPLHDTRKLAEGLAALPSIGQQGAMALTGFAGGGGGRGRQRSGGGRGSALRAPLQMNPQRTGALFNHDNDLYFCKLDGTGAVRLTRTPGKEELATFSPDGKFVAFVRDNNLYVVDIATQTERAMTTDGSDVIFNGRADWVYFEEIFHRGRQAYYWSPDSRRIAFLRFDDTPVRRFPLVDPVDNRPTPEITPYPKAGDPNPHVKLGIVTVGGTTSWVDLTGYSESACLVIRAGWMPDGQVYFYVQDRAQTWLDFNTVSAGGGEPTRLFREKTKAWVDDPGAPTFLKDGSFLLPSERTGWMHFYHYGPDGKLKGAVTSGEWEARTLHTVDEANGWVYISGTKDSHIAGNLYRVKLDGSNLERLTQGPGSHFASVSPKGNLFIDSWSSHENPQQARLYQTDKTPVRTLDTNPVYALEEYRRGKFEMATIPTPDGFTLEASILKPPQFDPKKKYPVWFTTYGGPHAPTISDSWGVGRLRDEMLAQMGYIVFRADPRSASGKGACSTWTAYRNLGIPEMKDIETAIYWLTKNPWVDAKRIGMHGHSYGGFMTSFCLTHSKLFAAGIAGAPVTDWRNYDSIYTERYMNTPQENPDGYKNTSVVRAAKQLHGRLMIAHGLMDDNVHPHNAMQLLEALQRADKDYEVLVYPRNRHGIFGKNYERKMLEFMNGVLKPGS